jgi:hypothetical protein
MTEVRPGLVKPKTASPSNAHMIDVHALGRPGGPPPNTAWQQPSLGWAGVPVPQPTTALLAPNMPDPPLATRGTGSDLELAWSALATDSTHGPAHSLNLRYSVSGTEVWTLLSDVVSPVVLTGLSPRASYDIQLQAANPAGQTAWSVSASITTGVPGPFAPQVPDAPKLNVGSGSGLVVTWVGPAIDTSHGAATSFNLRFRVSGMGSWVTVPGVVSPHILTGLGADLAYDVAIQAADIAGTSAWSEFSTATTATAAPNAPAMVSAAPPPDGTADKLTVTWSPASVDSNHGAAISYNIRNSPTGAGSWSTATGVTSPHVITGLLGATEIDVEVQAVNSGGASAWSAVTTGTTWGATVAPSNWGVAPTQTHSAIVMPNGGANMTAIAAPTAVTGAVLAWSTSALTIPITGLITAYGDGQANGWGMWFNNPDTPGTWYLWMLARNGSNIIGANVTGPITVD